MINKNILASLKSHDGSDGNIAAYTMIITDVDLTEECDQDELVLTLGQIDTPVDTVINNANFLTTHKLSIMSNLSSDSNGLFSSELIGYIANKGTKIVNHTNESPSSKNIEVLETTLQKEIEFEFDKNYKKKPAICVNIDEESSNLYNFFEIEFNKQTITTETETTEIQKTLYTGAKIKFKGLKTKRVYPFIYIVVIGEKEE